MLSMSQDSQSDEYHSRVAQLINRGQINRRKYLSKMAGSFGALSVGTGALVIPTLNGSRFEDRNERAMDLKLQTLYSFCTGEIS